jgi:hypothetical protein
LEADGFDPFGPKRESGSRHRSMTARFAASARLPVVNSHAIGEIDKRRESPMVDM